MHGPLAVTGVFVLLLTGCVYSIETAIPGSALIQDDRLLGTWTTDSSVQAVITRQGEAYLARYTERGRTGDFTLRLGRIAGALVFEVQPQPDSTAVLPPFQGALIPGRFLFVLHLDSTRAVSHGLNGEVVERLLRAGTVSGPALIDPEGLTDHVVLTGDTVTLPRTYARLLARREVLESDSAVWRRMAPR